MKIHDQKGVLHITIALLVILLIAIAGTFYLVSSKAATPGKPTIRKAVLATPKQGKGVYYGTDFCAKVKSTFKVYTKGSVDSVEVDLHTQAGKVGKVYNLTYTGKGLWKKSQTMKVCTSGPNRSIEPTGPWMWYTAKALYGKEQDVRIIKESQVTLVN